MKSTQVSAFLASLIVSILSLPNSANASFVIAHQGSADPLTEGFSSVTFAAPSTVGPLANDLGIPAWSIVGSGTSSQFGYKSGALTAPQVASIASNGFTLTMVARAIQGVAHTYDPLNPIVIAGARLDTATRRFEIELGLNSSGDTVAVLPTSITGGGTGDGSIFAPGPSYTLTGLGNGYHTYLLVENPLNQLADLFVDGVDRIQGYAGHTSFVSNSGLVFNAISGGQGNFNFVQVTSVPEPSTAMLLIVGAVGLVAVVLRKFRKHAH